LFNNDTGFEASLRFITRVGDDEAKMPYVFYLIGHNEAAGLLSDTGCFTGKCIFGDAH